MIYIVKHKIYFILILLLGLTNIAFAGKESKKGTAGALELLIPVGARGAALGNSTISYAKGIEAVSWNPSGIVNTQNNIELYFARNNYIADISLNNAAISANINGFGSIALNIRSLDLGSIEETTEDYPEGTGNYFSPVFFNVGLSYARRITDRLNTGFTVKFIQEKIFRTSAYGIGFDAGIQYFAGNTGLIFGIVLKNIGPAMKFEGTDLEREIQISTIHPTTRTVVVKSNPFDLPSSLELGFAYQKSITNSNNIILSGAFENNNYGNDLYKAGLEYSYNDNLFLRVGYILVPEELVYIYQYTYGFGLKYSISGIEFAIDYAYRPIKYFGSNSIINVQINF
ncbi:MAG: hypothetical protein IGBAC_1779 [Ignavibacteriae bacterium]|nr:MAG: hypothetical protein IGBAC_1779 [Ignavibacteriota bacterium]